MALRWIKLKCDIFTNDKMMLLETYEDGLYYQMIWIKLLCLAGKKENHGIFVMRDGRAYTTAMLSHVLSVDTDILDGALDVFEELCMIDRDGGVVRILGWCEHQEDYFFEEEVALGDTDIPKEERRREQAKARMRRMRERKRQVDTGGDLNDENRVTDCVTGSVTDSVTDSVTSVTGCVTNVTPLINIKLENRKEKEEEHTSLREERDKNKKENSVTLTGDEVSLSLSKERDFESLPLGGNKDRLRWMSSDKAVRDTAVDKEEETPKSTFGTFDNVLLTKDEFDTFRVKFPDDYADRIDELSIYIATSGKDYKSHYATLLSFARTRFAERESSFNMGSTGVSNAAGKSRQTSVLSNAAGVDLRHTLRGELSVDKHSLIKKELGFDPEEALREAIRRSGFFCDEDE